MYCGIDVAKNKSQVCIIDQDKKVISEFEIEHSLEGFQKLEQHLTKDIKIGMETTGNYSKTIYDYLKKRYDTTYLDNIQMKNFVRMHYPFVKNDKSDARMIAIFLTYGFKKIEVLNVSELKDLAMIYSKTNRQLTRYKFMFKNQINVIFPELENEFYLSKSKAISTMLLKYPNPEAVNKATVQEIYVQLIKKGGNTAHTKEMAVKIKELAKTSIGIKDYPINCFKQTIEIMLFLQTKLEQILQKMKKELMKTPYHSMLNVWGYQEATLAQLVGEVGDIRRFPNAKKFVKYCGYDISENQSGSSISKNSFTTKRGNAKLRNIFHTAVLVHLAYKKELSIFFKRLKDKGKHPKQCMVACGRKLAVKAYYDMLHCHQQEKKPINELGGEHNKIEK